MPLPRDRKRKAFSAMDAEISGPADVLPTVGYHVSDMYSLKVIWHIDWAITIICPGQIQYSDNSLLVVTIQTAAMILF